jgi:hypothetical protein
VLRLIERDPPVGIGILVLSLIFASVTDDLIGLLLMRLWPREYRSRGFLTATIAWDPAMGPHRPERHSPYRLTKLNGEVWRRRVRGEPRPTLPGRRTAGVVKRAASSSPVGRSAS